MTRHAGALRIGGAGRVDRSAMPISGKHKRCEQMTFDSLFSASPARSPGSCDASAGQPVLLVVDDDLIQRRIIAKLGRQAGFSVLESFSVDDAKAKLLGGGIDCATIDLSLGEQSGIELLSNIARVASHILILIVSGRSADALKASHDFAVQSDLTVHAALPKPLDLAHLRESLSGAALQLLKGKP